MGNYCQACSVFKKNTMQDYQTLSDQSKVWIYQSNRVFADKDVPKIRAYVRQFAAQWISHNRQLKAFGDVFHNRFIVLMVDESQAGASGCSIDKSVYFLKELQNEFEVDLFDRMSFSFVAPDGTVMTVPREEFAKSYAEGKISDETPVFDTLVATKGAFDREFKKPLSASWHRRMV